MSPGTSVNDGALLAQLAQQTFQNATQACGERDDLTKEVSSLCKALQRLERELSNPTSLVNRASSERRQELDEHAADCGDILKVLNAVLKKYNGLAAEEKRKKKLWQKIQFGNGETKSLAEIRMKLSAQTSAIMMCLNLCSLDSFGKVEATLHRVEERYTTHGKQLKGIRKSLHWVTANMSSNIGDGSSWTAYADDDEIFWKTLRRELVLEGFHSAALEKHKRLIKAYIEELGSRGVFDDQERDEAEYIHAPRLRLHRNESQISLRDRDPEGNVDPLSSEDHKGQSRFAQAQEASNDVSTADASSLSENESDDPISDEESVLTSFENISQAPAPVTPNVKSTTHLAVQIEEVTDEEFASSSQVDATTRGALIFQEVPRPILEPRKGEEKLSEFPNENDGDSFEDSFDDRSDSDSAMEEDAQDKDDRKPIPANARIPVRPPPVEIDEVLDDDFAIGSHPNVYQDVDQQNEKQKMTKSVNKTMEKIVKQTPTPLVSILKKSSKTGRFAGHEFDPVDLKFPPIRYRPEDLRFIFFREFRDFDTYQELEESYQALLDEKQEASSSSKRSYDQPVQVSSFITHSPHTPPATMFDLQYYRIPASYFHKFWHPQRVPIYLHGNVFDGISLTNWIYNWTAYAFNDNSFQMSTIRRFGRTVIKLGSALTDIEHAEDSLKRKLPKDLYDRSGVLWEELENIINDIMSDAEDHLAVSRDSARTGKRLEVEFVTRFCQEMIAGDTYYYPIENLLKKTEQWCKTVKFHKDFIMLWNLWTN